jgi:DNA-binding beta-propeller fold protein YncE
LTTNGTPRIEKVIPAAALPGGEIAIQGSGFSGGSRSRPDVRFGEAQASLVLSGDSFLIARVPEGADGGAVRIFTSNAQSQPYPLALGQEIADNLHPVANPAVDAEGSVYVTYSGQRGQRVPVSLYKVTGNRIKPFVTELMNPSGLAVDQRGTLYVSCRHDGTIHRVTPDGRATKWVEGMGVATGIAFDRNGNLYVGDRSGTIFKIDPQKEIFVFATLEPSVAAYHLAFSPAGDLYVSGPTQSSFDRVHKITSAGEVSIFYRGLGRPQGLAFDSAENLYVAASLNGQRGIVRINSAGKAEVVLSGSNIVGLALLPTGRALIATNSSLYRLDWDVQGMPLNG